MCMPSTTDKRGCTECRCDLYNVTVDEYGRSIGKNYTGGLYCCYDQTQCKVKEGFNGGPRKLFLRYTVTWLDWSDAIVPVKVYIIDVTDRALLERKSEPACKVCFKFHVWSELFLMLIIYELEMNNQNHCSR
jgi:hypothetical protein